MDTLTNALARQGFLPHGFCFHWSPELLWGMVGSDLSIALAYFSIPLVIVRYASLRPHVNLGGLPWLFGSFIFACGLTHIMDVWTIWRPDYALQTVTKVVTALISVTTALVAWRVLPQALSIPSVAEQTRALKELRAEVDRRRDAEEHLASTLATIEAGFISTDSQGQVTRINAVAESVTGWNADDARGRSVWQVFEREGRPPDMTARNPVDVVRDGLVDGTYRQRSVCTSRDGRRTPVDLHALLNRGDDGEVRGMTIVFRDVSRLSSVEAEVRRLASVVESSADAIIVKDLGGRITDWNPAAERMFGYTAAEAVGEPITLLIPSERASEERPILIDFADDRVAAPLRTWRVAKDGRHIEVSLQASPLRDALGHVIGGINSARDLTHQRQIELALRHSESRLRFALESAAIGAWEMDLVSGAISHSERYNRCFGNEQILTRWTRADLLMRVHVDERDGVADSLETAIVGQQPWHAQFRIFWPDGSLRWLRMDGRVAGDSDQLDGRMVGIVADITESHNAEESKSEALRLEAENRQVLEASRHKSQFLANMSHELRTPLNAVIGFADLLRGGIVKPDSPKHDEYLGLIAGSGRHLLQLINDVLDLSKIEAGKMDFRHETVNVAALIDDVASTLSGQAADRKLEVLTSIDQGLHEVHLDAGRLKQVLFNYLSNAMKFTEPGGRIQVRALAEDAEYWRLEVEDSGIGINDVDIATLFREFHQLDSGLARRHQGTGLGLALTRRLVEALRGHVGVRSALGVGSCFWAVLPRDSRAEIHPSSVLLAWRDVALRRQVIEGLAASGLRVDATDAASDIVLLGKARRYGALALDLTAPATPGLRALAELRGGTGASALAPVRALRMSAGGGGGGSVAFAVDEVLAKPLIPGALDKALAAVRRRLRPERPILVVDDDPAARALMVATLQAAGLSAMAVGGGAEALESLAQIQPTGMVLDLMMPGVDGFQVLDALRQDPLWRDLPVLIWTAMALAPDEEAALQRSAEAIASKGDLDSAAIVRDAVLNWFLESERGDLSVRPAA